MSHYECTSCGVRVSESDQKDFSKMTNNRCGKCWTVISSKQYPADLRDTVTIFANCGTGLGDNVIFDVVKREYLKCNPHEKVLFLGPDQKLKDYVYLHSPSKIFVNEFSREESIDYRGVIRYNLLNEVCAYAERGIYPKIKHVDIINEKPYVVAHFRNVTKAPEKNVNPKIARDIIGWLLDRTTYQVFVIGNDKEIMKYHLYSKRIRNMTGLLELDEIAGLCKRSELFIGKDSGLVHVAAAAGAKIVSWGFNGEKWEPKTGQPFTAITKDSSNIGSILLAIDLAFDNVFGSRKCPVSG